MRTSLTEIRQTEEFLAGKMEPGEALVFKSQLLISPRLKLNTAIQERLYALARWYGRRQLRLEIAQLDRELFEAS